MREFTSIMWPPVRGIQRREDWPELDAKLVDNFNRYLDPSVQAELTRRTEISGNLNSFDAVYVPYMKAWAWMELTRYARKYRGEPVHGCFLGASIGMQLPSKK